MKGNHEGVGLAGALQGADGEILALHGVMSVCMVFGVSVL